MNNNKYYFNKEYKEELLQGRTIKYIANMIGMSKEYLTNILNGKTHCSSITASKIASINLKEIKDYFMEGE